MSIAIYFLLINYLCNFGSPYLIATMCPTKDSSPNSLQFSHNFRCVFFIHTAEPVKSFLARYLQRQLMEKMFKVGKEKIDHRLTKVVEWLPKVWQQINKFSTTYSSAESCIGLYGKLFIYKFIRSAASCTHHATQSICSVQSVLPDYKGFDLFWMWCQCRITRTEQTQVISSRPNIYFYNFNLLKSSV